MGTCLQTTNMFLPVGSIEAYIQRVYSIPLLTAEEEYALASKWQQTEDLKAAQQLVLSHLRYVVKIAKGYIGYGLPLADLIQEGTVGLMKAVKRFDPSVGVRLVSFAVHWIKSELHEFVIKNWRIVKIATTKEQRKLFFNLRSAKKRLGWLTQEEVEFVAKDLGVPEKQVIEMEMRLNAHDATFNLTATDEDDSKQLPAPEQYLEHKSATPEEALATADWQDKAANKLAEALKQLDPRSLDIIRQRWFEEGKKATLEELAAKYGVSPERIRQLENNALKKLQKFLKPLEVAA